MAKKLTAEAPTPQTQPLVQPSDVTYLGTLRLPDGLGNPNGLGVAGDKMYVATYKGGGTAGIAVVTVPPSGIGNATLVSGIAPVPNTIACHRGGTYNDVIIGGILPRADGSIVAAGFTYYDGGGGQWKSHWSGPSPSALAGPFTMEVSDVGMYAAGPEGALQMQTRGRSDAEQAELAMAPPESSSVEPIKGSASDRKLAVIEGPLAVSWYRSSMVGGYMGHIPPEWQALFGGSALSGQCCIPIIARTSLGPCASVFDPATVDGRAVVPAKMIVGYPYEHPSLGAWEAKPPGQFYGASDQLGSVAFPPGTRSVLFTGRHGDTNCYGPATSNPALVGTLCSPTQQTIVCCYDPFDALQGNHGAPYRPSMWAYDANDLLAVKEGKKKPWDVVPYARFDLPGLALDQPYYLRAGWFDPATMRYYVGDTASPLIHVFQIGVGSPPPPPPPPPSGSVVTVDSKVTYQTMRGWEITAEANQYQPGFSGYVNAALDRVVEAGINRVRLEVRSGSENTADSFGAWKAAGYPDTGPEYQAWRAKRYETINDNSDPNNGASAGFHWTELDAVVDAIVNPLRLKLAAKGEALYVNLTVVAFWGAVLPAGQPNVHQSPAEYAEFLLECFKHLQAKYGGVPSGINVVLEPDNTTNWGGTLIGQTIAATGAKLAAAGFTPDFIAPSTTNMTTAAAWFDQIWAVTAARPYLKELSYHRYSGVSVASLQAIASKAQAAGISTSMLEWWDTAHGIDTLHEDLTVGRNSAHQQAVIVDKANPAGLAIAYIPPNVPTTAVFTTPTTLTKQYYTAARMGAVRLGATSTLSTLAPLAFRNVDGRFSVVVKATAAASFSVAGLPAGTYGVTFATASQTGNRPDVTLTAGQALATDIPAAGVLTALAKSGGPPPPPPPSNANCVESPGAWSAWSACSTNNQRTRTRVWTTTTAKQGAGTACPFTGGGAIGATATETASEACLPPPPPAVKLSLTATVVTSNDASVAVGSTLKITTE